MIELLGWLLVTNIIFAACMTGFLWVIKGKVIATRYFKNMALTYDQLLNTTIGGDPDETLSSVFGKAKTSTCKPCRWFSRFMCWWLAKIDKQHCSDAIEKLEGGRSIWRSK